MHACSVDYNRLCLKEGTRTLQVRVEDGEEAESLKGEKETLI